MSAKPFEDLEDSSGSLDMALEFVFGNRLPGDSRNACDSDDRGDAGHDRPLPQEIGRYQIEGILGSGGFGTVYLGQDPSLDRSVAIKVPHEHLVASNLEAYLSEAQLLAMLDHPNILPIYDFGSTDEFSCYIVSKFVDGSLASRLRERSMTRTEAAKLAAIVAEALHHAHKQHLVHRDIKPSNLLLDASGHIYIADFGIAIREDGSRRIDPHLGTPAYMSPEQARGEGHRVDGQSDIFSLGVVLYEMISGRRPFRAKKKSDLIKQVIDAVPRPPRQIDESIPRELERICLKAMSRNVRHRYTTAFDLAEDLWQFLAEHDSTTQPPTPVTTPPTTGVPGTPASSDSTSSNPVAKVVPKGLRSFDRHDSDFFLQLLPGPRDRLGLPESIRFWKTKVEETDDQTFSVGLIYGPSGCGKSSFVHAGLIPNLADDIRSLRIEASPSGTEDQLLLALRERFPHLPTASELPDTMAALRTSIDSSPRKVLIVIDQFEQWLHNADAQEESELGKALRQCDGNRVQCLLMVRDDFWMATTRFFQQLEIHLLEGGNAQAIDLFPPRHARQVLARFGQAFGTLPTDKRIAIEQEHFLDAAIENLKVDGKVMCVRLALFAEMMKDRSWSLKTFKQLGGTEGLGVRFLDEQFGEAGSSLKRRLHQDAARAILRELLPKSGETSIKGRMCSSLHLQRISEYENHQDDFQDLIRLLDGQLHLITPVDQLGVSSNTDDSQSPVSNGLESETGTSNDKHYQLTHDYLVRPIREWLVRKQKATRRGRAELCLSEHTETWTTTPQNRFLPGFFELLRIHCFTARKRWAAPERKLIKRANTYYGVWGAILTLLIGAIAIVGLSVRHHVQRENEIRNATTLVNNLLVAPPNAVQHSLATMEPLRKHVEPILRERFEKATNRETKLLAAMGIAEFDQSPIEFLVQAIEDTPAPQRRNLVRALEHDRDHAIEELLSFLAKTTDPVLRAKLAVVLLHFGEHAPAQAMLEPVARNPEPRTRFIDAFATWHISLSGIPEILRSTNSNDFRSGLCVSLAELPPIEIQDHHKIEFASVLSELWMHDYPGVHSAAGFLLRRWGMEEPKLNTANIEARVKLQNQQLLDTLQTEKDAEVAWSRLYSPLDRPNAMKEITRIRPIVRRGKKDSPWKSWYVNSLGMTMIRIQCPVVKEAPSSAMSDREVTVGQFAQFIRDEQISNVKIFEVADPNMPCEHATFDQAFRFCNWLSKREGLTPCYRWADGSLIENRRNDGYQVSDTYQWSFYCVANTGTHFYSGNDTEDLWRYANFNSDGPVACGDRIPNTWGFFDMLGNVKEWNSPGDRSEESVSLGIIRGGGYQDRHVTTRAYNSAGKMTANGFRIVRMHPMPDQRKVRSDVSKIERVKQLEDALPFFGDDRVNSQLTSYFMAKLVMGVNLASFESIDRTLALAPGTLRWRINANRIEDARKSKPIEYPARISRFLEFARSGEDDNADPDRGKRVKYAEARLAQLAGKPEEALPLFETLIESNGDRPEPLFRSLECQIAMHKEPSACARELEAALIRAAERFPNCLEFWSLLIRGSLNELGKSTSELLAVLDAMPDVIQATQYFKNAKALVHSLENERVIRINCGCLDDMVVGDSTWRHDMFYFGGYCIQNRSVEFDMGVIAETDDTTVFQSLHSFHFETAGSYRLPLPNGDYRVTLMFCDTLLQGADRIFDIAIENKVVLQGHEPKTIGLGVAHQRQFETHVSDGQLDIDLLPLKNQNAKVSGVKIELISASE